MRRSVSQSFVRGRLAPRQASRVILVVRHSHSVVLIEVERAVCKIHVLAGHSYWTYSDITIWTIAANPIVHTQLVLQLVVSEYAKQRAQMQLFYGNIIAYQGIRRTFASLDANGSGSQ